MSDRIMNKGSIIAIIAVILGGSGLGVAAFNMLDPKSFSQEV